ncbi:MAG: cell division protein FtsA [Ignavibacteria bacterium RIFOXYB2_FULL_35_12]|nr:MAG: cell division protein FtsA [Ignavibacteria bacterium GWA2_36_19]OGU61341.1 MAG: cell division protein FtsA [Ignavibacteria bacterium GWF2_35_20]OGU79047.1 MAG: cell division protein FtsA [Ignavibacteria bacterium RIFOXYA2_FULL_35_9]OGU88448.1 MAG: cell division protein FtsA [Ignavibacteria bacterium RIFOXYA12_FULL_35_25]OGU92465.1 MAG: cell division protein FtsA [Ignavibacteria bacterium RIFOXYC12_FULL_35_11]OGU95844.1 MAG: cell division protein FtsA [Ignavibacteria bacterium RIFOXYB12
MKKNIVAGLDLGTTKVCAVIAEQLDDEHFEILGSDSSPSEGLHKGLVANISKTADGIKEAVSKASNKAGVSISSVNVGVAGEHITSMRHRNYVTISREDKEITKEDLNRLEADVRTIRIPSDREILHIIFEEFSIDYQGGIENPIGMSGSRLEATNHIVLASSAAIQNIKKSVERAGLHVNEYVLQPIASSTSVLDDSEKDLGVALIDIGGGTTDIAVFQNKSIKHTKVIGVAGNQVTNDIRESLGIVSDEAEKLKKEYGYAIETAIIKDEDILIRGVGARGNTKIPISLLTQIISLRMRELFILVDNEIRSAGFKNKIKAGIVLTGGGSLLRGCTELAEDVFGLPARIGVPQEMGGKLPTEIESPEFATVMGLLRGVPGSKTKDYQKYIKVRGDKRKNKVSVFFKKVQQFFDEI